MIGDYQPWNTLAVDLADPVNRHHDLNRGRTGWWLGLPGWDGGIRFVDLMGLFPATLTSMGNASNGWRASTRPGAIGGALLCDGTAGYATTGLAISRFMTGAVGSMAGWIFPTGAAPVVANAWLGQGVIGESAGFASLGRASIGGLDRIWAFAWDGAEKKTSVAYSANAWSRVVWTHDGTTLSLYLNGTLASSVAAGTITSVAGTTYLGRQHSAATAFWAGRLDDLSTWSRCLSAADVQADYELSRLGYPGVLNRVNAQLGYGLTLYAIGSFTATAGPATFAGTGTPGVATPSIGSFTATAGPATFAGAGTWTLVVHVGANPDPLRSLPTRLGPDPKASRPTRSN